MPQIVVHEINFGDVEDSSLYAAGPIYECEHSEAGKWIMLHSKIIPIWNIHRDGRTFGYCVYIVAELENEDLTYYQLKYGCTSA